MSTIDEAIAFGVFWLVQVAIILRGIEGIKFVESYAAPLLLASSVGLLIWGFDVGGEEYGEAIWDPVTLVARLLADLPVLLVVAMVIVVIAQISTNMAANVVSPSNDFSNLSPRQISFRTGTMITAVIGTFTWLVGYGSLLASFLAVMLVDYWLLRRAALNVADSYRAGGQHWFSRGDNIRALIAVAAGVIRVCRRAA